MTSLAAPPAPIRGPQERQVNSTFTSMNKLPLQRLRPAISKYLKVLDNHLHRLQQHQGNMDKMMKSEQWTQLHQEQIHAKLTAQQVKATLQQLQYTRSQVVDYQIADLHALLLEFKDKVTVTLDAFLHFCRGNQMLSEDDVNNSMMLDTAQAPACAQPPRPASVCIVPDNSCAAASREQLKQEIEELHAMVLHFVHSINVTHAGAGEITQNTTSGFELNGSAEEKQKSGNLKVVMLSVGGALLGGAVAGPVGMLTGIEIGTLMASVGGGVAGLAGSTILKAKRKSTAKTPDLKQKYAGATIDDGASHPQRDSHQPATVCVRHPCVHSSDITHPVSQTVPTPSPVDNRPEQPGNGDENGNLSLLDQILLWGRAPLPQ